jgi:hydroxyacyl-ACP dehydratase HTD2-like protein with hotdog domain
LVCVELVERWLETSSEGREKGKSGGMTKFEYRATSPMYVDRKMEVFGKLVPAEGDGEREVLRLWVVQDGKVGMTATAYFG